MQTGKLLIFSSEDSNMRYATGLRLTDPFIWTKFGQREYILVSSLEYPTVKKKARQGVKVVRWDSIEVSNLRITGRKKNLADVASAFLLSFNVSSIEVPENTWAQHMETFREHNIRAKTISPFFPERIIKTREEILAIKQTGLVTKKAYNHVIKILKNSTVEWDDTLHWQGQKITSEFLQQEIEKVFIENDCFSMESIVSCGESSSEPHNRGSGDIHAGLPIVIDLFPRNTSTGYFFDMTRTVVKGTPSPELKKMFLAVKRAQAEGIKMLAPGPANEIHSAVASVLENAGYETTEEEGFIHSTGHGLGVDIHEPPRIRKDSEDILEEGMVVTIEPGLYYKEIGGVRIEDTLLVTADGCQNLTNLPKTLVIR